MSRQVAFLHTAVHWMSFFLAFEGQSAQTLHEDLD